MKMLLKFRTEGLKAAAEIIMCGIYIRWFLIKDCTPCNIWTFQFGRFSAVFENKCSVREAAKRSFCSGPVTKKILFLRLR